MASVLRVPAKIFQQDNPTLFSGGRRQNSAALFSGGGGQSCSVFGRRKLATRISSMSTPQILHLEKPSASSQHLDLPIMVNGCNGKMGRAVIQATVSAGLHPVPVSFSCAEESGQTVDMCGKEIKLHGPSGRESILASVVDEYPNLIVVDHTVPDAVNDNADLYCKVGVPFVMGTIGGDKERLYKTERFKCLCRHIPTNGKTGDGISSGQQIGYFWYCQGRHFML